MLLCSWQKVFAMMLGLCGFEQVSHEINGENFNWTPVDRDATGLRIVQIDHDMITEEVLALLDKMGLQPGTLVGMVQWWLAHPDERKTWSITAIGSLLNGRAQYICPNRNGAKLVVGGSRLNERELWSRSQCFVARPK